MSGAGQGTAGLGKYAKSSSALPGAPSPALFEPAAGGVSPVGAYDPTAQLQRFALQSAARRILPGSRTAECLRAHAPVKGRKFDASPVEVTRSAERGGACQYRKLLVCGSVWQCPVCAAKISERRRVELLSAMTAHKSAGGDVLLLTLTSPHYAGDVLADVLAGQAAALKHFNAGRAAQKLNAEIGCIGQVRALEVTHGRHREVNNGWHPHYHILLFVRSGQDLEALQDLFFRRWRDACAKAGLPAPSAAHGVRLHDGSEAAYYAGKWGLDSELTKGHIKKSPKAKGETPFDLLRAFLSDGDRQAAALFREFAGAFKGKRQLFWSHGLKARFGIGEASDGDLAVREDDSAFLLGKIGLDDWRRILKVDVRGQVLALAGIGGWEPVKRFLCDLRKSVVLHEYEKVRFHHRE